MATPTLRSRKRSRPRGDKHGAEASPPSGFADTDDVDFTNTTLTMAMFDLEPVEADEFAVLLEQEKVGRVEPGLIKPGVQVIRRPVRLVGMSGEDLSIEAQPCPVILSNAEGTRANAKNRRDRGYAVQMPVQVQEAAYGLEPEHSSKVLGSRGVIVGPEIHVARAGSAGGIKDGREEVRADAAAASVGMDDDFAGGAPGFLLAEHDHMGVANKGCALISEKGTRLVISVTQPEKFMLAERVVAIGDGGRIKEAVKLG